ncbi:MAG: hypothetical protein ABIQ57_03545 [Candidatus Kapaibacterium sp.]
MESLYVYGATVGGLAGFLRPDVPWVWILNHMPEPVMRWWRTSLPVNVHGDLLDADYRMIACDIMLETGRFLEALPAFEVHGIVLIQSFQRMPGTFSLERIPENQQDQMLRQNGAFLRVYLPHAVETARVQCFEEGYLSGRIASAIAGDRMP